MPSSAPNETEPISFGPISPDACAQILVALRREAPLVQFPLAVAGENAAAHARGPGSFAVALLDELAALRPESLSRQVRLS